MLSVNRIPKSWESLVLRRYFNPKQLGVLFLAVLLLACAAEASAQRADRLPLTGYVDRSGTIIEPATWHSGSNIFHGNWVAVSRGGKAGYLNLRTRATTGLIFDGVNDDQYRQELFAFGPEPVFINGKWGYATKSGEIVIEPQFSKAESFDSDGLALVKGENRYQGMINLDGEWAVEPRYQILHRFGGAELTGFMRGRLFGLIDRNGKEIVPPKFERLGGFGENGLAPAAVTGSYGDKEQSLYGYIDQTGEFVIPEKFEHAASFRSSGIWAAPKGLARVSLKTGEMAYIDSSGEVVTQFPSYASIFGVGPNMLVRFQDRSNGKYGFLSAETGKVVIPARFVDVGGFTANGLSSATDGDLNGFIDSEGQWAIPPLFSGVYSFDAFGHAQVRVDGRDFLIDSSGNEIANLTNGEVFYHQNSEFASFIVYPGEEVAPTEGFENWALDSTLYALPIRMQIHGPNPIGNVRLTFACEGIDALFEIVNEGNEVRYLTKFGLGEQGKTVMTSDTRRVLLNADQTLVIFSRHLLEIASLESRYPDQIDGLELSGISRQCSTELINSQKSLAIALEAMRSRANENGIR